MWRTQLREYFHQRKHKTELSERSRVSRLQFILFWFFFSCNSFFYEKLSAAIDSVLKTIWGAQVHQSMRRWEYWGEVFIFKTFLTESTFPDQRDIPFRVSGLTVTDWSKNFNLHLQVYTFLFGWSQPLTQVIILDVLAHRIFATNLGTAIYFQVWFFGFEISR